MVCDIVHRTPRRYADEDIANARLIAAAPQLLAACEEALSLLSNTLDFDALVSDETDAVVALQDAIAAVRGGHE